MTKKKSDAKFVLSARQQLGMSQPTFAEQLGVTKRTIIRWEQGAPLKRRDRVAITLLIERPRAQKRIA